MHFSRFIFIATLVFLTNSILAAGADAQESVFPDKNLEAVVRKEVFSKRNNEEPITADDVKNISQIVGNKAQIESLEGLQHCKAIMRIELAGNAISDLTPLAELTRLQSIDLADNKIESLEPLAQLTNIQYLRLNNNQIGDIKPLSEMKNMRALYLEGNAIKSLEPIAELKKITSLYAGKNNIENFAVVGNLHWLSSLNLKSSNIQDLHFLKPLQEVRVLNLSDNKIEDLTPLIEMCKADVEDRRRFAPYLRLHIDNNPIVNDASALAQLRDFGVRIFDGDESKPETSQ